MSFSRRSDWNAAINRFTIERKNRRARGQELLDLTISNPTHAGFEYPLDELADALSRGARAPYDPQPLGITTAREAVARETGADAANVVITASTSEAYSFLFKLLCDAGDSVLTPTPSYPLLEHLAALEQIELRSFPLEFHRRWELHAERVRDALTPRTRAIVAINPNNPTGSYVSAEEQDALAALRVPIIADEVFFEYRIAAEGGGAPRFVREDVLTFALGGLSKSCGLPHYKLGWIVVSGPEKAHALNALELIADNFLSVSTPVQQALPDLLRIGERIRAMISERTKTNHDVLQRALPSSMTALPVEGGWSAVVRMPRIDDDPAIALLERSVVVQPGYFFDFASDGYIVLSLLTEPEMFEEGVRRIRS
ncbi:MAG TPA: pyridoxal phosphate-dependent aminotransferase [Thermoanaerobaculia bacterium]|nr:pyridoxal phosphate-dependent aminotransferase [Thermoanaerobaculia bacterium]